MATNYENWIATLDKNRPDWWLENATQQELEETARCMLRDPTPEQAARCKTVLRSRVERRLWVAANAWVEAEFFAQQPLTR